MTAILQSSYNDRESEFYVFVNSNISGDFLNNNPSCFSTKLDEKIPLDGQWQVSIQNLHMNHSWDNNLEDSFIRVFHSLSTDEHDITSKKNLSTHATASRPFIDISLKGLNLHKINFIDNLNELIKAHMKTVSNRQETRPGHFDGKHYATSLKFGYDLNSLHHFITFRYHAVFIPLKLARMLGFQKQMFRYDSKNTTGQLMTRYTAIYPPEYLSDDNFLYIYSNIVEETSINESRANILKITPVDSQFGEILSQNYEKEMFVNVNTSKLHEIKIEIRNGLGDLINAKFGSTIICLHFIKRSL